MIGLGFLLYTLTQQKIQTVQLDNFQAWSVEQSEAITNKFSYYFTVNDYLGKLLQGMALQDTTLFKYTSYPFNRPDSTTFPNLPTWGYTVNSKVTSETAEYYKKISEALNYFAKSLLTHHEDIPILSMYASYVNSDNTPIMTFGYPNTKTFTIPDSTTTASNWYSKALASSSSYTWTISTASTTASDGTTSSVPVIQFSRRFDANGKPYVITCVEINLNYLQYHTIDQFTYNTRNVTGILLADYSGNIILSSNGLGKNLLVDLSQTTLKSDGTYTVTVTDWVEPQRVAELQDSDTFTWTDTNSESYHVSSSMLNLTLDTSDTIYVLHFYPSTTALASMDTLYDELVSKTTKNIIISVVSVFAAFLLMLTCSFLRARTFLEPLRIISEFSSAKSIQKINKAEDEKDIKPIKLPDGADEVGEFVATFKKLIQGLPAGENNVEKDRKRVEQYPKNYLKGKVMPWKEQMKVLKPETKEQPKDENDTAEKIAENILNWLPKKKI